MISDCMARVILMDYESLKPDLIKGCHQILVGGDSSLSDQCTNASYTKYYMFRGIF